MCRYRHLLLGVLCLFVSSLQLRAQQAYAVADVPNVYLQDSTRRVSDPGGLIRDIDPRVLDEALASLAIGRDIQPTVVLLPSIGERDIEGFAVELFRYWGLGDKSLNNGLLILYVADQRRVRSEVGYGLEGVLTDGRMGRIQREVMIPYFREGQTGQGLLAGIQAIDKRLDKEDWRTAKADRPEEGISWSTILYFALFVLVAIFVALLSSLEREASSLHTPSQTRARWASLQASYGLAFYLFLILLPPLGLVVYLWGRKRLPRLRAMLSACERCSAHGMQRQGAQEAHSLLSPVQQTEEAIRSRHYEVYRCAHCGEIELYPQVVAGTSFQTCPTCSGRTLKATRAEHIRLGGRNYVRVHKQCLHCGHRDHEDRRDDSGDAEAALAGLVLGSLLGSSRSGGGFGGGGFGGGSWGGGSSGGGGATSGW